MQRNNPSATLNAVLAFRPRFVHFQGAIAVALISAWVWGLSLRTGLCGRYPPPSGWITGALFVAGFGLVLTIPLILTDRPPRTRGQWILAAVSLAEGAAAFAFAIYLLSKFAHAYDCG